MTIVTHALATTPRRESVQADGSDAVLAYVFGVGVDIDFTRSRLPSISARSAEAAAGLLLANITPGAGRAAVGFPAPCLFLGTWVPALFFLIHLAMDYSVGYEKMPVVPYSPLVTQGFLVGVSDKAKEAILIVILLCTNLLLFLHRCRRGIRPVAALRARHARAFARSGDVGGVLGERGRGRRLRHRSRRFGPGAHGDRTDPRCTRRRDRAPVRPRIRGGPPARHPASIVPPRSPFFWGARWVGFVSFRLAALASVAVLLLTTIVDRSRLDPGVETLRVVFSGSGCRTRSSSRSSRREFWRPTSSACSFIDCRFQRDMDALGGDLNTVASRAARLGTP